MLFNSANLIIIDEENPSDGRALTNHLKKFGFNASFISSCKQALNELKRTKVDLVITGIKSSEMDGLEFLRRIRTLNCPADVIIYTEFGNVDNYIRATKLGAADFINKPIEYKEIITIAKRILNGKPGKTKITTTDRRRHPRFSVNDKAYIFEKSKDKENKSRTNIKLINLSLSGLLFEYYQAFEINKVLEIQPVLEDKKITTPAAVRRSKESGIEIPVYHTGVEFIKLSANHRKVIERYLKQI